LHHIAVLSGDLLGAGLDPKWGLGEAGDGMQRLAVPCALKAVASLLPAIGDHAPIEVIADALRPGAVGDDRIERLFEHIRPENWPCSVRSSAAGSSTWIGPSPSRWRSVTHD